MNYEEPKWTDWKGLSLDQRKFLLHVAVNKNMCWLPSSNVDLFNLQKFIEWRSDKPTFSAFLLNDEEYQYIKSLDVWNDPDNKCVWFINIHTSRFNPKTVPSQFNEYDYEDWKDSITLGFMRQL